MTDEEALLAAIVATPDDDLPRLAYADWLDEHGEPERAEFIRVQCRMAAAVSPDPKDVQRAAQIEQESYWELLGELPLTPIRVGWRFHRGFPVRLEASIGTFLGEYEFISRVPGLRSLCLEFLDSSDVEEFTRRPWSPQWAELELTVDGHCLQYPGFNPGAAVAAIANCPQSAQLRVLRLKTIGLGQDGRDALLDSPYLEGLQLLALPGHLSLPWSRPFKRRFGDRLIAAYDAD